MRKFSPLPGTGISKSKLGSPRGYGNFPMGLGASLINFSVPKYSFTPLLTMIVFNVKTVPKETNALDLVRHRLADASFGTERVRSGLALPPASTEMTLAVKEGEWLAFIPLHVPTETKSAGLYFWQEQLCFILIPTPAHPLPKPI